MVARFFNIIIANPIIWKLQCFTLVTLIGKTLLSGSINHLRSKIVIGLMLADHWPFIKDFPMQLINFDEWPAIWQNYAS